MVKSIQFIARQGLSGWSFGKGSRTRVFYSRRNKWDPTEIDSIVGESNFQKRRWSHAAAAAANFVPSDTSNDRKGKKRVSKQERRAMVESFVNKYRAVNAGKFPTPAIARKEVGGSYYYVRELIQELEYKFKACSTTNLPTKDAYISFTEGLVEKEVHIDSKKECLDVTNGPRSGDKYIKANVGLQSFSSEEITLEEALTAGDPDRNFDHNETGNRLLEEKFKSMNALHKDSPESDDFSIKENKSSHTYFVAPDNLLKDEGNDKHPSCREESIGVDEKAEGNQFDFACNINSVTKGATNKVPHLERHETEYDKQQKASFESQSGLSGLDPGKEQHYWYIHKPSSDNSGSQENADIQKKSTLWDNLKSFADGIVNLWKKL